MPAKKAKPASSPTLLAWLRDPTTPPHQLLGAPVHDAAAYRALADRPDLPDAVADRAAELSTIKFGQQWEEDILHNVTRLATGQPNLTVVGLHVLARATGFCWVDTGSAEKAAVALLGHRNSDDTVAVSLLESPVRSSTLLGDTVLQDAHVPFLRVLLTKLHHPLAAVLTEAAVEARRGRTAPLAATEMLTRCSQLRTHSGVHRVPTSELVATMTSLGDTWAQDAAALLPAALAVLAHP